MHPLFVRNMMYFLGIFLGIITAIFKGIDTSMNKSLMGNTSAIEHSLYRIIFVTPVLFIAALLNWHMSGAALNWLLLYGMLEAFNILFHQMAIKSINVVHAEILSKSKSLMTYIVSIILIIESVSLKGSLGVLIFTIGMLITIDFKKLNAKKFSTFRGYIYELISVFARTVKPFVLYKLLSDGLISNEVQAFISMPIAFVLIYLAFRPKLSFGSIDIKRYAMQAIVVGLSMITSGYAILYAGALITAMTENFSIFVVGLIAFLLYKDKIGKRVWIGGLIAILGVILVSL